MILVSCNCFIEGSPRVILRLLYLLIPADLTCAVHGSMGTQTHDACQQRFVVASRNPKSAWCRTLYLIANSSRSRSGLVSWPQGVHRTPHCGEWGYAAGHLYQSFINVATMYQIACIEISERGNKYLVFDSTQAPPLSCSTVMQLTILG